MQEPYDGKLMTMRPFKGTGDKRLESFRAYDSLRTCAPSDDENKKLGLYKKLRPLYQTLDEELDSLPLSQRNKDYARFTPWLKKRMDEILREKEVLVPEGKSTK